MLYKSRCCIQFNYQVKIYFYFIKKVSNIKVNVDELIKHKNIMYSERLNNHYIIYIYFKIKLMKSYIKNGFSV